MCKATSHGDGKEPEKLGNAGDPEPNKGEKPKREKAKAKAAPKKEMRVERSEAGTLWGKNTFWKKSRRVGLGTLWKKKLFGHKLEDMKTAYGWIEK